MHDNQLRPKPGPPADDDADLDIEAMVEQIRNDLQGRVSGSAIRQALLEILPKYEHARVRRYIPIFVCREVLDRLRVELPQAPPASSSRAAGPLRGDPAPDGRTATPYDLTTGIVLPENS
ncbi:MAG TPA: hypothetical protein PKE64_12565 [Anaerolineae bacterium]|nr:hypothetical protein [Anaerolineae bacterium]HMR64833.1 hypothetical protein [Anaerolineae bacterium]